MNFTFSVKNGVPNIIFKFSPQKHPYRRNESQKTGFEGTFSPRISGSIGLIVFKTNGVQP